MRLHLDHAATTPILPAVREAMEPWLSRSFGNPSSLYAEGLDAKKAVDQAREIVSEAAGCHFGEVIFTGSGTEAANLAMVGSVLANETSRNRILISAAEHHCVLHTIPILNRLGCTVELIPVDTEARTNLELLSLALDDSVLLVAAMHANNELGTFNDVAKVHALSAECGARFFCDAVQSFPLNVADIGAELVSASAHKINGPKGVGALIVRAGTPLNAVIPGGGQEREMRGGTENVAGIVGFAAAIQERAAATELAQRKQDQRAAFLQGLLSGTQEFVRTASGPTLEGHLHLRFPGLRADSMLIRLDRLGIAASSGAACSSGSVEPSHVLQACGYSEAESEEGLRFTFGGEISPADTRLAGEIVAQAATDIRLLNEVPRAPS